LHARKCINYVSNKEWIPQLQEMQSRIPEDLSLPKERSKSEIIMTYLSICLRVGRRVCGD
jgi:hypothetical protein